LKGNNEENKRRYTLVQVDDENDEIEENTHSKANKLPISLMPIS
jgi:hypothetical protein